MYSCNSIVCHLKTYSYYIVGITKLTTYYYTCLIRFMERNVSFRSHEIKFSYNSSPTFLILYCNPDTFTSISNLLRIQEYDPDSVPKEISNDVTCLPLQNCKVRKWMVKMSEADFSWGSKVSRLQNLHLATSELLAWLSTLGGLF